MQTRASNRWLAAHARATEKGCGWLEDAVQKANLNILTFPPCNICIRVRTYTALPLADPEGGRRTDWTLQYNEHERPAEGTLLRIDRPCAVRHYKGERPGMERLVREVPRASGPMQFYRGRRGSETLVTRRYPNGDIVYFTGSKGKERPTHMHRASDGVTVYYDNNDDNNEQHRQQHRRERSMIIALLHGALLRKVLLRRLLPLSTPGTDTHGSARHSHKTRGGWQDVTHCVVHKPHATMRLFFLHGMAGVGSCAGTAAGAPPLGISSSSSSLLPSEPSSLSSST
jgi:hypothetical protein